MRLPGFSFRGAAVAAGWLPLFLPWLAMLGLMAAHSWFISDDAFISFRYVRNLLEGQGLVYNPGEYVEGYSNFLWVLELAAIWGLLGVAPEYAAQWLSVGFTVGTLGAMLWWAARMPGVERRRLTAWLALGLVGSSATFAAWTSGGGLETRQFTFFVVLAVVCLSLYRDRKAGLIAAALSLAGAAYTRPEGPLIAAICLGWFVFQRLADAGRLTTDWRELRGVDWRGLAYLALPCLGLIAAHFLFRYVYYGEWLPNTYYAKFVRPWYESGFMYLLTAAMETGLYLLLPLAWVGLRRQWRERRDGTYALVLLLIGAHMIYVMRIGGDSFEFRPLDFYWPLLALPAGQGIVRLGSGLAGWLGSFRNPPRIRHIFSVQGFIGRQGGCLAVILFVPVVFYSNGMQGALLWTGNDTHRATLTAENAGWLLAAPGMPALNVIAKELDRNMNKYSLTRHSYFRNYPNYAQQIWQRYSVMERGLIPGDAVAVIYMAGIPPYYLPDLRVVDRYGLTDKTIARNPVAAPNNERRMGHDRKLPPGYLEQRGYNFEVHTPVESIPEALSVAQYTVRVADGLYMPFNAASYQWVADRFDGREWTTGKFYTEELVAEIQGETPVLAADFAVYVIEGKNLLLYVKEECDGADADARFSVHIYPVALSDLPDDRQQYGFDNRDFSTKLNLPRFTTDIWDFTGDRMVFLESGGCAIYGGLPDYPIAAIHTGQYISGGGELWAARFDFPGRAGVAQYNVASHQGAADLLDGREWTTSALYIEELLTEVQEETPNLEADFAVYVIEEKNLLLYVKEECEGVDVDAKFFLHIYPAALSDLPERRQPYGFDNRDFISDRLVFLAPGYCAIYSGLPDYPIAAIRTGQYISGEGELWAGRFDFPAGAGGGESAR